MKMPDGYVILTRSDGKAVNVDLEALKLVKCRNCKYWEPRTFLGTEFHLCVQNNDAKRETYENDWCCWAEER